MLLSVQWPHLSSFNCDKNFVSKVSFQTLQPCSSNSFCFLAVSSSSSFCISIFKAAFIFCIKEDFRFHFDFLGVSGRDLSGPNWDAISPTFSSGSMSNAIDEKSYVGRSHRCGWSPEIFSFISSKFIQRMLEKF